MEKIAQMNTYFADKLSECNTKKKILFADDRKDEANFWQIRANIYDIFRTILSVAQKTQKNETAVKNFFIGKLDEMTNIWLQSGEKAAEHGDVQKSGIEQVKVETAKEISSVVERLWGEHNDGN